MLFRSIEKKTSSAIPTIETVLLLRGMVELGGIEEGVFDRLCIDVCGCGCV